MSEPSHTRVPKSKCAVCRYEMDCASPMGDVNAKPTAGDLTVCLRCATPYQFTRALTLAPVALSDLPDDVRADVEQLQTAIARLRGQA